MAVFLILRTDLPENLLSRVLVPAQMLLEARRIALRSPGFFRCRHSKAAGYGRTDGFALSPPPAPWLELHSNSDTARVIGPVAQSFPGIDVPVRPMKLSARAVADNAAYWQNDLRGFAAVLMFGL